MAYWLLKSEPQDYSWRDLVQAGHTVWDGVKNPLALKHLRTMQPKDLALFYHTGKERQVIGIVEILAFPYPDPASSDPKYVVVDLQPVQPLPKPVTLVQIKQDPYFTGWDLIRLPRLSVVPVPPEHWQRMLQLATR